MTLRTDSYGLDKWIKSWCKNDTKGFVQKKSQPNLAYIIKTLFKKYAALETNTAQSQEKNK